MLLHARCSRAPQEVAAKGPGRTQGRCTRMFVALS